MVDQIDKKLFRTIRVMHCITWIITTVSIIGIVAALFLHFYKGKKILLSTVAPAFKLTTGLQHINGKDPEVEPKRSSIITTISNNQLLDSQKY